jgi:hypothetical protein
MLLNDEGISIEVGDEGKVLIWLQLKKIFKKPIPFPYL